jgi:hypothetical protein
MEKSFFAFWLCCLFLLFDCARSSQFLFVLLDCSSLQCCGGWNPTPTSFVAFPELRFILAIWSLWHYVRSSLSFLIPATRPRFTWSDFSFSGHGSGRLNGSSRFYFSSCLHLPHYSGQDVCPSIHLVRRWRQEAYVLDLLYFASKIRIHNSIFWSTPILLSSMKTTLPTRHTTWHS